MVEVLAVRKGDLVQPNQTILRVSFAADDLWVKVRPEVGKFRLGQVVDVLIDSYPDKTFLRRGDAQIAGQSEFYPSKRPERGRTPASGVRRQDPRGKPRRRFKSGMAAEVVFLCTDTNARCRCWENLSLDSCTQEWEGTRIGLPHRVRIGAVWLDVMNPQMTRSRRQIMTNIQTGPGFVGSIAQRGESGNGYPDDGHRGNPGGHHPIGILHCCRPCQSDRSHQGKCSVCSARYGEDHVIWGIMRVDTAASNSLESWGRTSAAIQN